MCNVDGLMFGGFYFNTLSWQNYFFQRVWGMYKIVVEIPEGWGCYFSGQKMEIPGRREGLMWNSLCGGGMDIFWNYTIVIYSGKKQVWLPGTNKLCSWWEKKLSGMVSKLALLVL